MGGRRRAGEEGRCAADKKSAPKAGRQAPTPPTKGGKDVDAASLASAAEEWAGWGAQRQDRFIAVLGADTAQALKALPRARDLAGVAEIQRRVRVAALACLHHHLHAPKGATHTGLQRALALADEAVRFQAQAGDLVDDRRPQLAEGARVLAAEAAALRKAIVALAGVSGAPRPAAGPKVVPTRGKTAPGRLRRVDALLACLASASAPPTMSHIFAGFGEQEADAAQGPGPPPTLVDLGFGEVAVTTVEMARLLWRRHPRLRVVGIESDRARADGAARAWQAQGPADLRVLAPTLSTRRGRWGCEVRGTMEFRHGGFLMPLGAEERRGLMAVRAMNVLRQYDALEEVSKAHRSLVAQLADGGVLLEGSSDPIGDVVVAHLLRKAPGGSPKAAPAQEAMFFALNLRRQARQGGLSLDLVGDNLPQLLYARKEPAFEEFFALWQAAVEETRSCSRADRGRESGNATDGSAAYSARAHFLSAGRRLAAALPPRLGGASTPKRWLRRGWLMWMRPPYPGA